MPCALVGSRHGTPALPGPPTPPHSPPFQEALPSRASCLSLGQLEPCQPPPYNEDFLPAQLSSPRLGWERRQHHNQRLDSSHPSSALLRARACRSLCRKGQSWALEGAGRVGLRASLLVSDLSAAELGGAFRDQAVRPTVPAQMAPLRPTEGRARYPATQQRIIMAIIVLAFI